MSRTGLANVSGLAVLVLIASFSITAPSSPVSAQSDFDNLDCNDLWYERNGLYAHYGHCFQTERGKRAFHNNRYPNVCKPPYGKLPPSAASDVAAIKRVEARKGCR